MHDGYKAAIVFAVFGVLSLWGARRSARLDPRLATVILTAGFRAAGWLMLVAAAITAAAVRGISP